MDNFEIIGFSPSGSARMPLFTMPVAAGVPLPAESDVEKEIDLNEFLVRHPAATFFARVKGSFAGSIGISDGDILVVDTAIEPSDGKYVLVSMNGELTVKIYRLAGEGEVYLVSSANQFLPLRIEPYVSFSIIGVVTKIIHSL